MLNNLVGNAADAMLGGGHLALRSRDGEDWNSGRRGIWLTVADTGEGMSQATLQRVFARFFTTKGISGTGLGLWISHEIVKRHKGELLMRFCQRPGRSGTVARCFYPSIGHAVSFAKDERSPQVAA